MSEIVRVWKERATTVRGEPQDYISARELACLFRSCLQSEPDLVRWRIPRQWVQANYRLFLNAMNAEPVPYEKFACELAGVMPRKRLEQWKGGKRLWTHRYYLVPDPAASVVQLAVRREAS